MQNGFKRKRKSIPPVRFIMKHWNWWLLTCFDHYQRISKGYRRLLFCNRCRNSRRLKFWATCVMYQISWQWSNYPRVFYRFTSTSWGWCTQHCFCHKNYFITKKSICRKFTWAIIMTGQLLRQEQEKALSRSKNCEMKRCFIAIPMGRPLNLAVQGSVKSAKFSSKTFDVAFEIYKSVLKLCQRKITFRLNVTKKEPLTWCSSVNFAKFLGTSF